VNSNISNSGYTIQLPVYEGPLDLLLELIERAELDITKVSLAEVTDQYLDYIRNLRELDIENLASFLVIAARLIQIKSESLLPRPPVREPGEEDPGDALARQLVAYKRYKQVAIMLSEREQAGLRSYLRIAGPMREVETKLDLEGITLKDLRSAMIEVLSALPEPDRLEDAVEIPRVRVRDKIIAIVRSIRKIGKINFKSLVKNARSRLEIVISFIAVLELIKQRQVEATQDQIFGDIEVKPGRDWKEDQEFDFDLEFEE
jgi:segregation and condensation protein A